VELATHLATETDLRTAKGGEQRHDRGIRLMIEETSGL
jgi:hypothetical protein